MEVGGWGGVAPESAELEVHWRPGGATAGKHTGKAYFRSGAEWLPHPHPPSQPHSLFQLGGQQKLEEDSATFFPKMKLQHSRGFDLQSIRHVKQSWKAKNRHRGTLHFVIVSVMLATAKSPISLSLALQVRGVGR